NIERAGYAKDPLKDDSLSNYQVFEVPMTTMTLEAAKDVEGITKKDAERAKNRFALGLVAWMYSRPTDVILKWVDTRVAGKPGILQANMRAFRACYNFGE